jgi:ribokinase
VPAGSQDQPTLLVVGSTMIDMIAYADRVPEAGETLVGNAFSLGFGGKGANQAVMCALLGAAVTFVGCVGEDDFGRMTLANLDSFGIDTSGVSTSDLEATGAAPIWVEATGENRIIIVPGANNLLDPDAVERAVRAADADVVLTQLELPDACVERALQTAREMGSRSILNPAPMRLVPREVLSLADWLVPNRAELDGIAGLLSLEQGGEVETIAGEAVDALAADLVVTLGPDGALLRSRSAGAESIRAPQTVPVDTTGAGDAFVGAFAYALALGAEPVAAIEFGCACASASVELPGTQTSFPRGERLEQLRSSLRLPTETAL